MSNTFKIDPSFLVKFVSSVVDAANKRIPVKDLAGILQRLDSDQGRVAASFDADDLEKVIVGTVNNLHGFDIRAGRSGGVGRVEMFKGGASDEPSGVAAQIAARLREYCKAAGKPLEIPESRRIVNAYLNDLILQQAPGNLTAEDLLSRYGG
jgi:hypothetical protein